MYQGRYIEILQEVDRALDYFLLGHMADVCQGDTNGLLASQHSMDQPIRKAIEPLFMTMR